MPDKDRVSIRLLDCVETEEEEHVEGMKEPAGDSHHEMHGEEKQRDLSMKLTNMYGRLLSMHL